MDIKYQKLADKNMKRSKYYEMEKGIKMLVSFFFVVVITITIKDYVVYV
jgi:hypothetical protein